MQVVCAFKIAWLAKPMHQVISVLEVTVAERLQRFDGRK